jgi:hypothetical protein
MGVAKYVVTCIGRQSRDKHLPAEARWLQQCGTVARQKTARQRTGWVAIMWEPPERRFSNRGCVFYVVRSESL